MHASMKPTGRRAGGLERQSIASQIAAKGQDCQAAPQRSSKFRGNRSDRRGLSFITGRGLSYRRRWLRDQSRSRLQSQGERKCEWQRKTIVEKKLRYSCGWPRRSPSLGSRTCYASPQLTVWRTHSKLNRPRWSSSSSKYPLTGTARPKHWSCFAPR